MTQEKERIMCPPDLTTKESSVWFHPDRTTPKIHRDGDQPAIICVNGTKEWYQHGQLHRDDDRPAIIWAGNDEIEFWGWCTIPFSDLGAMRWDHPPTGTQEWFQKGQRHRDGDQPAIIYFEGTRVWYQHDELHRDDDQPAIINSNGTQVWYQHDQLHRDGDQPAIIYHNGKKEWWQHGVEYHT